MRGRLPNRKLQKSRDLARDFSHQRPKYTTYPYDHSMCLTDSTLLLVYYKYALISTEFRMAEQDPASLVELDGGRASNTRSNTRFLTRRRPVASILGRGFAPCTCACSPRNVMPRLSTPFTGHCSSFCNDLCQSKAVHPRRRDLCACDTRSCC